MRIFPGLSGSGSPFRTEPEATARHSGGAVDSISARARVLRQPASRSRSVAREPAPERAPARTSFLHLRNPEALLRRAVYARQCAALVSSLHGKDRLPSRSTLSAGVGDPLTTPQISPGLAPANSFRPYLVQHNKRNHLRNPPSRATLILRLLLLYRLWVVKRSQGHTCGHFFVRLTALQSSRTKLEDGRGSVEGLGTWASDSSNVVLSRNPADGKE